ncbi:MAG TPA: hypothetical protein VIE65_12345 [Methylobacter sp.]|jgi:hypothetical protein
MTERRQEILKALESFQCKSAIDISRVSLNKNEFADGIEFYINAIPRSARAIVETYKDGRIRRHKILYKVKFCRKDWEKGSGRRTVTVFPSDANAFASIVSNISGQELRICASILHLCDVVTDIELARMKKAIAEVIKSHVSCEYGRKERELLFATASSRSMNEIRYNLSEAISDSLANGIEEEEITLITRKLIVASIHNK